MRPLSKAILTMSTMCIMIEGLFPLDKLAKTSFVSIRLKSILKLQTLIFLTKSTQFNKQNYEFVAMV